MDYSPIVVRGRRPRRPARRYAARIGCLEPVTVGVAISDIRIVVVALALMAVHVDCQCSQLVVSKANYQQDVDGTYILYKTCNGHWSWIQLSADDDPSNFIYAGCSNCQSNGSWYIGKQECSLEFNVNPVRTSATTVYPYNVPQGSWQEVNGRVFINTSLTVDCTPVLTALQIACLVCSAIVIVVATLLAIICVHRIRRRHRVTSCHSHQPRRYHGDEASIARGTVPDIDVVDDNRYVTPASPHITWDPNDVDLYFGGDSMMMYGALPIEPPLYATVVDQPSPPPYETNANIGGDSAFPHQGELFFIRTDDV